MKNGYTLAAFALINNRAFSENEKAELREWRVKRKAAAGPLALFCRQSGRVWVSKLAVAQIALELAASCIEFGLVLA